MSLHFSTFEANPAQINQRSHASPYLTSDIETYSLHARCRFCTRRPAPFITAHIRLMLPTHRKVSRSLKKYKCKTQQTLYFIWHSSHKTACCARSFVSSGIYFLFSARFICPFRKLCTLLQNARHVRAACGLHLSTPKRWLLGIAGATGSHLSCCASPLASANANDLVPRNFIFHCVICTLVNHI